MDADVVFLPKFLAPGQLDGKAVIVLDVLRATTSMTAALTVGVKEIRVFDDLDSAARAARDWRSDVPSRGAALLCGESQCLPPPGFDLGNSPGAFSPEHAGRTMFISTTNGTRAIVAARGAALLFVAALVNAAAAAQRLVESRRDAVLLCAGTGGAIAMEDAVGAGAILDELSKRGDVKLASDAARMALRLFREAKSDLRGALAESAGGRNVIRAGLEEDIDFAARLNVFDIVGQVFADPLRVACAS